MKRVIILIATLALAACNKQAAQEEAAPPAPTEQGAGGAAGGGLAALKVPSVTFSSSQSDLDKGKEVFAAKGCNGCHKIGGGKLVGPDLKGVTARRDKEWLAKMILRPDLMTKEDATAKDLFKTYLTQMPNQGVNPDSELAPLMSYLKSQE
jgi:cytochrome c2